MISLAVMVVVMVVVCRPRVCLIVLSVLLMIVWLMCSCGRGWLCSRCFRCVWCVVMVSVSSASVIWVLL